MAYNSGFVSAVVCSFFVTACLYLTCIQNLLVSDDRSSLNAFIMFESQLTSDFVDVCISWRSTHALSKLCPSFRCFFSFKKICAVSATHRIPTVLSVAAAGKDKFYKKLQVQQRWAKENTQLLPWTMQ